MNLISIYYIHTHAENLQIISKTTIYQDLYTFQEQSESI